MTLLVYSFLCLALLNAIPHTINLIEYTERMLYEVKSNNDKYFHGIFFIFETFNKRNRHQRSDVDISIKHDGVNTLLRHAIR